MYKVQQFLFIISGLCLSSCFRWGPKKIFTNFPKDTALERTYSYSGKVLIVGAGASGLATKVLEQNHIDYNIIEATDRYGGRLKKNEAFADFPIDMGAEWIHNLPQY